MTAVWLLVFELPIIAVGCFAAWYFGTQSDKKWMQDQEFRDVEEWLARMHEVRTEDRDDWWIEP